MHGDLAYFNVNRHIQLHQRLRSSLPLVRLRPQEGRSRRLHHGAGRGLEHGWLRLQRKPSPEFHIVGGLHPDLPFQYYIDLIAGLKERFPQVHLKAFTMVEIAFFSKIGKMSPREVLIKFKKRDSIPCPAAAPRFSPIASGTSFAITRLTATTGYRSRAPRMKLA